MYAKYLRRRIFGLWQRRALRLRRAWQDIKDSSDPDQVTRLAAQMLKQPIGMPAGFAYLAGIPKTLFPATERCAQQVLAERLYADLQPGLMLALSGQKVGMPVPKPWRIWLREQDLIIRAPHSAWGYFKLTCWSWFRGIRYFLMTCRAAYSDKLPHAPSGRYDVFLKVPSAMLPKDGVGPDTNIVTWLATREPDVPLWLQAQDALGDNAGWITLPTPLPAFPSRSSYFYFVALSFRAIGVSLCAGLLGHTSLALILTDMVQLAHARSVGAQNLARRYVAENSRWFYRPLFTEWARQNTHCEAALLFYATNMDSCLQLNPSSTQPCFLPGYETMSWDKYLVWDWAQRDLVVAWGKDPAQVTIVGAVPLGDLPMPLPSLPERSIAVFDISPHKPAFLAQSGLISTYYVDAIAARFLMDLLTVAKANDAHLVLKQKRASNVNPTPLYRAALETLLADPDVHVLDSGYSAIRVAAACAITISMPFSSPSLIAYMQSRPSAFYDSTGRLIATDRQRHGLDLLMGFTELSSWVRTALETNRTSKDCHP